MDACVITDKFHYNNYYEAWVCVIATRLVQWNLE
jgi:hypothetical protein